MKHKLNHPGKKYGRSLLLLLLLVILMSSCQAAPAATTIPTSTPLPATDTPSPTNTPTSVPTNTPTPAPLTSAAIFDKLSPAVAFIDTPAKTGSGFLIEGGYLVTNAHSIWPFTTARVVFPDKTEFKDVPVKQYDMVADLALLGPIETDISPLMPTDGESFAVGSDVYLIGYPGEVDEYPQPSIARGLISRKREWEYIHFTYFQTDAAIMDGQGGGVLASERGEVIGMAGFSMADNEFGIVASMADIMPRVQKIIQGEDVDGIKEHPMTLGVDAGMQHLVSLGSYWETATYIVDEDPGAQIQLEITNNRSGNMYFLVRDVNGGYVSLGGKDQIVATKGAFEVYKKTPFFIIVASENKVDNGILMSNSLLTPYKDHDDKRALHIGDVHLGNLDVPGDMDYFNIRLKKDQLVHIKIESIMINAAVVIDAIFNPGDDVYAVAANTEGVFGKNAEFTFKAPQEGLYQVAVSDLTDQNVGGYYLIVDEPDEKSPTPIIPTPTPTPQPTPTPFTTKVGDMRTYHGEDIVPYNIPYPAVLDDVSANKTICFPNTTWSCFGQEDAFFMVLKTDALDAIQGGSHKDALALLKQGLTQQKLTIKKEKTFTNQHGLKVSILQVEGQKLKLWYIFSYQDKQSFLGVFVIPDPKKFDTPDREKIEKELKKLHLTNIDAMIHYMADNLEPAQ